MLFFSLVERLSNCCNSFEYCCRNCSGIYLLPKLGAYAIFLFSGETKERKYALSKNEAFHI